MASKRNNVREKDSRDKAVDNTESVKEEKPKQNNSIQQLTEIITANVVGILKPEVDKKMDQVQNTLVNELKDMRQLLPQPQTSDNGDESQIAPMPYTPNQPYDPSKMQQPTGQQPPMWIQPILQLLPQILKPQASGDSEILKMFMQVTIRNQMNRSAQNDWLMDVMMKKVAENMGVQIPEHVANQSNYLMGNIRKMGTQAKEDTIHGNT